MNQLTQQAPAGAIQLPAHLQGFGSLAGHVGVSAAASIGGASGHPRISIKQNRFRLLDGQEEFLVPALHLDVIVIGANDFVSKQYYASAYDPAAGENLAPTCWSDNGVGPSEQSVSPQSPNCQSCPYNDWGSKITPSGTKIKACSDSKKLAVLVADNPNGLVYELRVPAASMENLKACIEAYVKPELPLPSYVLRIQFDAQSSYPRLTFTPVSYITPEQTAAVIKMMSSDEVTIAVSKKDKARDPNAGAVGAALVSQQPLAPTPQAQTAPVQLPSVHTPAPIPVQQAQYVVPPQAVPMQPLPPVVEASKRARKPKAQDEVLPPVPSFVPQAPQYADFQQVDQQSHPAPSAGLPPEALPNPVVPQFVVAQPVDVPPPMGSVQAFPQDLPNAMSPMAAVPLQPSVTDASLDALLGNAMARS